MAYPKATIRGSVYVRGGGGCKHYRHEDRVQKFLVPLKPDLVFIGGISQGKDYEAIRDVIGQLRRESPKVEILLATGAASVGSMMIGWISLKPKKPRICST